MKRSTVKMLVFVLALALTVPMLMLSASAATAPDTDSTDRDGYILWTISKDGNTLTGNGKTYTYYETDIRSRTVTSKCYYYANGVEDRNDIYYRITSYEKSGEVVWLGSADFIYVTDEGRAHLDSFYSGESVEYVLYDGGRECAVNADFIEELAQSTGKRETFSLPSLARYDEYVINATDTKNIVGYPVASIFCINESLYYVDHEKLDNSYFDSYGDLSFRRGSIELIRLEGLTERKAFNVINSASYIYSEDEYEFEYYDDDYMDASLGFIWSLFVCPAGGIAAGVILPQSKKLGKPKKWYAIAALSGVMLLLSIALVMIQ